MHQPRGAEYSFKPTTCSAHVFVNADEPPGSHRRFDRYQHSSGQSRSARTASHIEHPAEQDAFLAKLVVRVASVGDAARGWESVSGALEGSHGAVAFPRAIVAYLRTFHADVSAAIRQHQEHDDFCDYGCG